MKTEYLEDFANTCKKLSLYFFRIAPDIKKYENEDGTYTEYISTYDKLKRDPSTNKVELPPYTLLELQLSYKQFNIELQENINSSEEGFVFKLVRHFLYNCLPYEKFLPVEEQFFDEKLFDVAELLYNYKAISREIQQRFKSITLMNDEIPF